MTKDELWRMAWEGILEGVQRRKSPYRTFTLATTEPDARIVVLRSAQPEAWIQFHTDARSSKVAVLKRDAR